MQPRSDGVGSKALASEIVDSARIKELESLCINPIRFLSADAVEYAHAGHPGMPMGAAAVRYTSVGLQLAST